MKFETREEEKREYGGRGGREGSLSFSREGKKIEDFLS